MVELLLSLGTPRKDCKPQAKEALKKFKTLRGVLSASTEELQQIKGIGPHAAFGIKLMQDVAREYLKEKIIDKPAFQSSQEIFDYLYHSMRDLKNEVFKVIYLTQQNQIIDTADLVRRHGQQRGGSPASNCGAGAGAPRRRADFRAQSPFRHLRTEQER